MVVRWDLAVCGGGPAGLAVGIRAAQAGFSAVVLERSAAPDKACGEGLMPRGVAALARLGVLERLDPERRIAFRGIRYVQEGTSVEARFADGEGLGIRRTALCEALRDRAAAAGIEVRQTSVRGFDDGTAAHVHTEAGTIEARVVVAADGLHSALRRAAGLDLPASQRARFGIRRHFHLPPWSDLVEVHWATGVEAYVTPVGPRSVNVALLFEADSGRCSFESLLARFPALRERVGSASVESEARGAGPLLQPVKARAAGRLALVGDAAGYVDAITGQGLALAFLSAERLVEALQAEPDVPRALRRYDASLRAEWLRYALPARGLLALSARPRLRSRGLRLCERHPALFGALVRAVA